MKYDYLKIIGLMTGTSMDGIDISLVKTNGTILKRLNKNYFYQYSLKTKNFLLSIINEDIKFNLKRKEILDDIISEEHYNSLINLGIVKDSDLIGFHGQTIHHNPANQLSIQLGNPNKLAKMLNKKVVFDFRSKDIEMGGQGAPIAPIYHQSIIEKLKLKLPSCILNIGGVANLSYWDGQTLIGFDTGPGNALMDDYMRSTSNKFFDQNGDVASKGKADNKMVNKFLKETYFREKPPKSLDRNSFIVFYNNLKKKDYAIPDAMATLTELTVESIKCGFNFLPKKNKNLIITGGGYRNNYLIKCLKERLDMNFLDESELNINFDYIESELIAFLSARSIYNLPFTFPSTTGVSKPLSGGVLYQPL